MNLGNRKSTKEEIEKIRELYVGGMNPFRISEEMHRDHTTIYYWIKKLKIKMEIVGQLKYGQRELICPNCGKRKIVQISSRDKYCCHECYSEHQEKLKEIKIVCDDCGKQIPKECKKLNKGKCFMCWFKSRKTLSTLGR